MWVKNILNKVLVVFYFYVAKYKNVICLPLPATHQQYYPKSKLAVW